MSSLPFYPYSKADQLKSNRIKLTRSQRSNLTPKEDARLKARSNYVCEKCDRQRASQRAHISRRWKSEDRPTAEDFVHLCNECHTWADQTKAGRAWLQRYGEKLSKAK